MRLTRHAVSAATLLLLVASVAASQCVDCENGYQAYPGHGSSSDGRRILTLRIDGSWDSSPGHTNDNVWNAVNAAIDMWNNATDQYGNKTGYYLQLDQGSDDADMTVVQGSQSACPGTIGCSHWPGTGGQAGTITLVNGGDFGGVLAPSFSSDSFKQLVGHEIGHGLGLTRQNCANSSVMSPFAETTWYTSSGPEPWIRAETVGVFGIDVDQVNQALNNSSQCAGQMNDSSMDLEDEGLVGGGGTEDDYTGGEPEYYCWETWAVTDYYYWNGSSWSFDYREYDEVIDSGCYQLEG